MLADVLEELTASLFRVVMEAVRSSGMLVNMYQLEWFNIIEVSHLLGFWLTFKSDTVILL
jgi:hypothetical protein